MQIQCGTIGRIKAAYENLTARYALLANERLADMGEIPIDGQWRRVPFFTAIQIEKKVANIVASVGCVYSERLLDCTRSSVCVCIRVLTDSLRCRKEVPPILRFAYVLQKEWFNGVFLDHLLRPAPLLGLTSDEQTTRHKTLIDILSAQQLISRDKLELYEKRVAEYNSSNSSSSTPCAGTIAEQCSSWFSVVDAWLETTAADVNEYLRLHSRTDREHEPSGFVVKRPATALCKGIQTLVRSLAARPERDAALSAAIEGLLDRSAHLFTQFCSEFDPCPVLPVKAGWLEDALDQVMLYSELPELQLVVLRSVLARLSPALRDQPGTQSSWIFAPLFYGYLLVAVPARLVAESASNADAWHMINHCLLHLIDLSEPQKFESFVSLAMAALQRLALDERTVMVLNIDRHALPIVRFDLPLAAAGSSPTANIPATTGDTTLSSHGDDNHVGSNVCYLPEALMSLLMWVRGYLKLLCFDCSPAPALLRHQTLLEHTVTSARNTSLPAAIRGCRPFSLEVLIARELCFRSHRVAVTDGAEKSTEWTVAFETRVSCVRMWLLEYYLPEHFGGHYQRFASTILKSLATVASQQQPPFVSHSLSSEPLWSAIREVCRIASTGCVERYWILDTIDDACRLAFETNTTTTTTTNATSTAGTTSTRRSHSSLDRSDTMTFVLRLLSEVVGGLEPQMLLPTDLEQLPQGLERLSNIFNRWLSPLCVTEMATCATTRCWFAVLLQIAAVHLQGSAVDKKKIKNIIKVLQTSPLTNHHHHADDVASIAALLERNTVVQHGADMPLARDCRCWHWYTASQPKVRQAVLVYRQLASSHGAHCSQDTEHVRCRLVRWRLYLVLTNVALGPD